MWEGGLAKDDYPAVGQTAYQAYLLLEKASTDLLPQATPSRQRALVCATWSIVHGYASLNLDAELEVITPKAGQKALLRHTLHLLLDQFAEAA